MPGGMQNKNYIAQKAVLRGTAVCARPLSNRKGAWLARIDRGGAGMDVCLCRGGGLSTPAVSPAPLVWTEGGKTERRTHLGPFVGLGGGSAEPAGRSLPPARPCSPHGPMAPPLDPVQVSGRCPRPLARWDPTRVATAPDVRDGGVL